MYARHFGLKQPPFSIAPDPRYLFMSERHREALAHLLYGVRGGGGFVVLTGEVGTGKTTVCRCFLEQIPKRCNVAYIFNPKLTVEELLRTVCAEFRIPLPSAVRGSPTVKDYVDALNEFLLRTHAVGQSNVLIIDEAQNLSADVLEQLRLLTNLETDERKLLQIVLIGQPELRALLARPQLRQLAQRVIARYHLGALSEAETRQYVRHRLAVAGLDQPTPFDAAAMRRLVHYSRGIPRRINLIADRALLGAYAQGKTRVDRRLVEAAAREVLDAPDLAAARRSRYERAALLGGGAAAGALLAGAIALVADRNAPGTATAEPAGTVAVAAASAAPASAAMSPAAASPVSAAAGAANPGAASADAPVFDLATGFASLVGNERQAWRELAQAWHVDVGEGDPCAAARERQIHCYRSNAATLASIRQLDRPGVLTLRDGGGRAAHALLVGLSEKAATLRIGGVAHEVPLVALADYWRGEYATLWRAPPQYTGAIGSSRSGPAARWLALQLASLRGDARPLGDRLDDATLRSWIHAFQLTQGLPSDGVAGPITLMQLNRAIGIEEPRLSSVR